MQMNDLTWASHLPQGPLDRVCGTAHEAERRTRPSGPYGIVECPI
jgi:hypothetical protein